MSPHDGFPAGDGDEPKLMRACDACRKKKIKCAGEKPECSTCRRNQISCHYSPWVRGKRTRKNPAETAFGTLGGSANEAGGMINTFSFQAPAYAGASSGPGGLTSPTGATVNFGSNPVLSQAQQASQAFGLGGNANNIGEILERIHTLEYSLRSISVNQSQLGGAAPGFSNPGATFTPLTNGSTNGFTSSLGFDLVAPATSGPNGSAVSSAGIPYPTISSGGVPYGQSVDPGANPPAATSGSKRPYSAGEEGNEGSEPLAPSAQARGQTNKLRIVDAPAGGLGGTNHYFDPDVMNGLIELFFKTKHPFLSVFSYDVFSKRRRNSQISDIFLYTMLAVTCRHSRLPLLARDPPYVAGEVYFERAKALAVNAMSYTSLDHIQAFILLGLYEIGRGKDTAWMYIGIATRMAQRMGLNRIDTDPHRSYSSREWQQREIRRRVWWLTFITENLASLAMNRPPSLHPDDCKVNHPSSNDQEIREFTSHADEPEPTGGAEGHDLMEGHGGGESHAVGGDRPREVILIPGRKPLQLPAMNLTSFDVELILIISKISIFRSRVAIAPHKWLFTAPVLTQELMDWFSKLPPHLQIPPGQRWSEAHVRSNPASCSHLINLHSLYYTAVVLTNRTDPHFLSQVTLEPRTLFNAQEMCWNSAEAIVQLMELLEHLSIQYYNCFFGMCLINAGLVFIDNLQVPPTQGLRRPDRTRVAAAAEYMVAIFHCLQDVGRYWAQNAICADMFRRTLRDKFTDLPATDDWASFLTALKPTVLAAFDKACPDQQPAVADATTTAPASQLSQPPHLPPPQAQQQSAHSQQPFINPPDLYQISQAINQEYLQYMAQDLQLPPNLGELGADAANLSQIQHLLGLNGLEGVAGMGSAGTSVPNGGDPTNVGTPASGTGHVPEETPRHRTNGSMSNGTHITTIRAAPLSSGNDAGRPVLTLQSQALNPVSIASLATTPGLPLSARSIHFPTGTQQAGSSPLFNNMGVDNDGGASQPRHGATISTTAPHQTVSTDVANGATSGQAAYSSEMRQGLYAAAAAAGIPAQYIHSLSPAQLLSMIQQQQQATAAHRAGQPNLAHLQNQYSGSTASGVLRNHPAAGRMGPAPTSQPAAETTADPSSSGQPTPITSPGLMQPTNAGPGRSTNPVHQHQQQLRHQQPQHQPPHQPHQHQHQQHQQQQAAQFYSMMSHGVLPPQLSQYDLLQLQAANPALMANFSGRLPTSMDQGHPGLQAASAAMTNGGNNPMLHQAMMQSSAQDLQHHHQQQQQPGVHGPMSAVRGPGGQAPQSGAVNSGHMSYDPNLLATYNVNQMPPNQFMM
ncbi:hypothetical protein IWQ60_008299 [Tieghemiomyces parasiticus]|uniref:Zn(2)-C6 fungal-type domain-containing protein n=1 Tax=Tieghemiomyces parasiticus TaxID=78921 RepID=A0A9W7ZX70_9FUNG|nr:hypothetical protein IWQ60_008299 [Tieghemiomyces parasiticus]